MAPEPGKRRPVQQQEKPYPQRKEPLGVTNGRDDSQKDASRENRPELTRFRPPHEQVEPPNQEAGHGHVRVTGERMLVEGGIHGEHHSAYGSPTPIRQSLDELEKTNHREKRQHRIEKKRQLMAHQSVRNRDQHRKPGRVAAVETPVRRQKPVHSHVLGGDLLGEPGAAGGGQQASLCPVTVGIGSENRGREPAQEEQRVQKCHATCHEPARAAAGHGA